MVTHNRNRQHISNKGRVVDWERLRTAYASTPAVGNVPMNARGDILGPGGRVVKTAEQVEEEYNQAYEQQMERQGGGQQSQQQMSIKRDAIPKGRRQARDDQMVTPSTSAPENTHAYASPEEALEKAREKAVRGGKAPKQEQDTTEYQKPEDVVQQATVRKKEEQKNKPDFTEGAMDPSQAAEGLPDVDPSTGESKSSSSKSKSSSKSSRSQSRKIVDSDE